MLCLGLKTKVNLFHDTKSRGAAARGGEPNSDDE